MQDRHCFVAKCTPPESLARKGTVHCRRIPFSMATYRHDPWNDGSPPGTGPVDPAFYIASPKRSVKSPRTHFLSLRGFPTEAFGFRRPLAQEVARRLCPRVDAALAATTTQLTLATGTV